MSRPTVKKCVHGEVQPALFTLHSQHRGRFTHTCPLIFLKPAPCHVSCCCCTKMPTKPSCAKSCCCTNLKQQQTVPFLKWECTGVCQRKNNGIFMHNSQHNAQPKFKMSETTNKRTSQVGSRDRPWWSSRRQAWQGLPICFCSILSPPTKWAKRNTCLA